MTTEVKPVFDTQDIHPNSPPSVCDSYALLLRELDRKQGMIDDLKDIAEKNYGLDPEDCCLLEQSVFDRDNIVLTLTAVRRLFPNDGKTFA